MILFEVIHVYRRGGANWPKRHEKWNSTPLRLKNRRKRGRIAPTLSIAFARGSQTFQSRGALFQLKFFHGALLILFILAAQEGASSYNRLEFYKIGWMVVYISLSLSLSLSSFIYSSNKTLKIKNTKYP